MEPSVHRAFYPDRYWNCADVVALANEVYDGPMALSDLDILLFQGCQLCSAQTTAEQDRYHSDVPDLAKFLSVRFLKEHLDLFAVEPVS